MSSSANDEDVLCSMVLSLEYDGATPSMAQQSG